MTTVFIIPVHIGRFIIVQWQLKVKPELGGHGHELNGHRCPCPRHGHGRGMDTKFLEKRGVDMDVVMKKSVKRGVDMDMATKNP